MATKNIGPFMVLYWLGLFSSCGTLLWSFVAFASPYWYQSWRRVHSPLANVGLWHICLSGYVKPRDPNMQSYVGCWWIHSTFFDDVADFIMPPWFRGCQALCVFELLCNIASVVLLSLYLFEIPRRRFYRGRLIRMFIINSVLMFASGLLVFIVSLVFAEMSRQENYFPRPWMNYLSWSYGFNVLSGFFAAFGGIVLLIKAMKLRDEEFNDMSGVEKEVGGSASHSHSASVATGASGGSKGAESFV